MNQKNPAGMSARRKLKKENFNLKGEKVCFSFDEYIVTYKLSQNCHGKMNFSETIYKQIMNCYVNYKEKYKRKKAISRP